MTDALTYDAEAAHAIVRSAASGDEVAFARLIAAHHPAMARVAYVICGDIETTHDATQSAWTIAWRRLHSVRDASQVHAWLVAVAANEARQLVRRRRRTMVVDVSESITEPVDGDPVRAEVLDLQRVLRGLKPEERSLLAMRFAAGLDSTEIAAQLGLSASGVRSRLRRLLERVRAGLDIKEEATR